MERLAATDVLVIGGGVSGFNAALGAAQTGASVTVLERSAFLGGTATGAMVAAFNGLYWHDVPVTGGTARLVLDQLETDGGGAGFRDYTAGRLTDAPLTFKVYAFDPEILKVSLDRLAAEHGIAVVHHAQAVDIRAEGPRDRVVTFLGPTGVHEIAAHQVIDASADAVIAQQAGATLTDPGVSERQPMTQMMRVAGVDLERYAQTPTEARKAIVSEGIDAGEFFYRTLATSQSPVNDDVFLLITAVHGLDGRDPRGLSAAEVEGRRQAMVSLGYLRRAMPGFERAALVQLAPWIGQRESVRVLGEETLSGEAVQAGADHPEAISYGGGPIDRHVGDSVRLVAPERPFAVPRGVVIPQGTSRLCVAGRIVSCDAGAMDGLRHMGGLMPVGHAAGVIAALAAAADEEPAAVPYDRVRVTLLAQGAILDPLGAVTA